MQEAAVLIPLIREKGQFQASIAYVQGNFDQFLNFTTRLHLEEQRVLEAYRYDMRKTSYLAGRLSAKKALTELFPSEAPENFWIDTGVFQFPLVRNQRKPNIQISISHCDELGLSLAFPEAHPMGIDVEELSAHKEETLWTQLMGEERLLLKNMGMDHLSGFTAVWSMKEAMSKTIKTGMMLDFKTFEIEKICLEQGMLMSYFKYFAQYKALSFLGQKYAVSLVLPRKTETDLPLILNFFKSMEA